MRISYLVLALALFGIACKWLSMEPVDLRLKLHNRSDTPLAVLLNPSYPDTSLGGSWVDKHLDPKQTLYIGSFGVQWDDIFGVTVFIFDEHYFDTQWPESTGSPDTYLEEGMVLKKWILTVAQLDSIDWQIYYP